nr:hypothetical protein [Mesorhizobium sp. L2C084A000]
MFPQRVPRDHAALDDRLRKRDHVPECNRLALDASRPDGEVRSQYVLPGEREAEQLDYAEHEAMECEAVEAFPKLVAAPAPYARLEVRAGIDFEGDRKDTLWVSAASRPQEKVGALRASPSCRLPVRQ